MLKGIDLDFRHDDVVIVQGDGAVFGAVRCAKDPKGRAEYSQKGMVTSS